MNIIRDEEMGGLMMIPLFQQWNVTRCNVKDCKEKHTTIITGAHEKALGMCEKHFTEGKEAGKMKYIFEF